jgi:ribosomal RNA-processing protein 9
VDETQLVFRGGSSKTAQYAEKCIDCVAALPPSHFVTGGDSGDISLWSVHKKKPLYTIRQAHGLDPLPPLGELSSEKDPDVAIRNTRNMRENARWITALATLPGTDIVLSGSWDGWIRAWQISDDKRKLHPLGPVGGRASSGLAQSLSFGTAETNGQDADAMSVDSTSPAEEPPLNGIVNGIAVFERRGTETTTPKSKGKPADNEPVRGLCIVAALGKEHRLGRWKVFKSIDRKNNGGSDAGGRNGAVVFEVPIRSDAAEEPLDKQPNGT